MREMDSALASVLKNVADLSEWWTSLNSTYRAAGCLLVALLLMWEATKASGGRDRKFFLPGAMALGLLAYGASLFVYGGSQ
jgi:hypothetical protein